MRSRLGVSPDPAAEYGPAMVTVVMVGMRPPTPALFEIVGFSNTSRTCSTSGVGCLWNVTPIDRGPPPIGVRTLYTPSVAYMMVTVLVVCCADASASAGGRAADLEQLHRLPVNGDLHAVDFAQAPVVPHVDANLVFGRLREEVLHQQPAARAERQRFYAVLLLHVLFER